MRKTLKIAAVAVVALLTIGALGFVYAYSQNGSIVSANEGQMGMRNMQPFFWSDNVTLPDNVTVSCPMRRMPEMRGNGFRGMEGSLQNATLSTVQGTVVTEVRGMLVLDTSSGQVRVMLPEDWTVGSDVVSRASLFSGAFASDGQNVTVQVLENNVFSNASFSINTMLAYEATNATGTNAYAVLPFNIQPSS